MYGATTLLPRVAHKQKVKVVTNWGVSVLQADGGGGRAAGRGQRRGAHAQQRRRRALQQRQRESWQPLAELLAAFDPLL